MAMFRSMYTNGNHQKIARFYSGFNWFYVMQHYNISA